MKRLNLLRILLFSFSAVVADAAVRFDQRAMLFSTDYQRGVNWQSQGGLPRTGSGDTPTPDQSLGGIVFGAVTYQQADSLDSSLSFPANAKNLNWPHTENPDGTVKLVLRAQVGPPYMMIIAEDTATVPAATSLITNGNFETSTAVVSETLLPGGPWPALAGWTILEKVYIAVGTTFWPNNSTRWINLTDFQGNGSMEQSFATTLGKTYQASIRTFNGGLIYPGAALATPTAFTVSATGNSALTVINAPGQEKTVTYEFTAIGTTSTLRIADASGYASNAGWIDDVKVEEVAPAATPPVVTSSDSADGIFGAAFSYQITAANSPTSYGATGLPSGLSVSTTTGLISGTVTTAGTYTFTVSATNASGTGTRTVTLTIGKATPVITWSAPPAITYGAALGAAQLNATANAPGAFVYTPASGTVLNAGANQSLSVAFTPNDPANYNGAGATVSISVGTAPLTLIANDATRTYGSSNPAVTGTIVGVVNGDPITATYSTTATAASNVGTYPITPALADPSGKLSNYNVALNSGSLTITPATLLITADNKSKAYGAALPALTASYSGFVNDETAAVLDTPAQLATAADTASAVGTYPITVSGAVDANYAIVFQPGTLTVTEAALTITADVISVDTSNAANWKQSTSSYIDNTDPNWPGVTTPLPSAATYTVNTAIQPLVAGFTGIVSGSGVTFYRSVFSLPSFATLTADLSALVDNNIQIFVNSKSLASFGTDLCGFCSGDFRLFIGTDGTVNNGYLGGGLFSSVQASFLQSAWISGGANEIVVAVRNLGGGDTGGFRLSLVLTTTSPVNNAPVVANTIANQTGTYGSAFSFTVPANTFSDADAGQTLGYTASGLPPGISFNAAIRTLSGIPAAAGTFSAAVTATDNGTPPLSATASFTVNIAATSASPPVVIGPDGSVGGSGPLTLNGGTLQAGASAIVTSPIVLGPAGANINTLLHYLRLRGVISGPGRLVKLGSGILALEGVNTYSGGTRIDGGIVEIFRNANLGSFSSLVRLNKAQLRIRTPDPKTRQTIQLARKIQVSRQGGKVASYGGRSTTQVTKSIRGSGTVRKSGKGTLQLTGNQKYRGKTMVKSGTLKVNKPSKVPNSRITVTPQRPRDSAREAQLRQQLAALAALPKTPQRQSQISSLLRQRQPVLAKLRGTGQVRSAAFRRNTALAAGNSPGSLSVVENIEMEGGSIIEWEINNAAGVKGTFVGGWDWVDIGGTLDISASAADPVVLDVRSLLVEDGAVEEFDPEIEEEPVDPEADELEAEDPDLIEVDPEEDEGEEPDDAEEEEDDEEVPYGELLNFDPRQNYRWVIATAQGGINGFSADKFQLDLTAFQNELEGGSFSVEADANNVYLVFTRFNHAPVASGQTLTGAEDSALPVALSGADEDQGDVVSFSIVTGPAHGTLTGTLPQLTYTPAPNFYGSDSFTFKVNDAKLDSAPATVAITVTPVNDAPVVANPIAAQTGGYGSAFSFTVPANTFTDVDTGQTLSYAAAGLPPGISFDAATRTLSGIPTAAGTFPAAVIATDDGPPVNQSATGSFIFMVNQAALSVTANNAERNYGEANPPLTGTLNGVVNGDNITAIYATSATAASPVGQHTIAPMIQDPNGRLNHYSVTSNDGTLLVTQAALTIKADDKGKLYGASLPALTPTYSGFVNGDTLLSLDTPATLSTTATAASDAGTYPITVSGATDANYTITFVPGTLTVDRVSLLITADNKSMVYGAALPALTVTYSGFANGDTPENLDAPVQVTTTATASSSVGTYPISAGGAADLNYAIVFQEGALTVTPAELTITADDKSKIYGSANPDLTASYSGFVNGDTVTSLDIPVSLSTAATVASSVGPYPITASAAADANYTIRFVAGTLTVNKAPLSVTANDAARSYGSPNPAFSGVIAGVQNNDNITATYASTATPGSSVGTYPIAPSWVDPDGKLANYTATPNNGTLTVNPVPLTVTANSAERNYGEANPPLSGTVVGVVNNDKITATYSTTATPTSPVDTYPIVPSLFDLDNKLGNYTVTKNNGRLTVKNVPPVVNAGPDQEKVALDEVTFAGSFTDPSSPSHVMGWDFGDGSPAVIGTLTPTHTYAHHGTYTVTLTVLDSHDASASDTLTVTVVSAFGCATEARDGLQPFVKESKRIEKAVKDLTASLEPKLWVDEVHLNAKGGRKALVYWRQATDMMEQLLKPSQKRENDDEDEDEDDKDDDEFKKIFKDQKKDTLSAAAIAAIQQALADLICASRLISETVSLEQEGLTALDPKRQKQVDASLARGQDYLDEANALTEQGDFGKAVRRYLNSWHKTQEAITEAAKAK
ncbi:MAG: MBG domain-containing protein [Verrucomicrobia bacterium]|nr:MBG domain-containing protein [Verrucomicrobiota bacterium]